MLGLQVANLGGRLAEPGHTRCSRSGSRRTPETKAAVDADCDAIRAAVAVAGVATGRETPNFSERRAAPQAFWAPERLARLRAVRRAIDPDGVVVSNHPIA